MHLNREGSETTEKSAFRECNHANSSVNLAKRKLFRSLGNYLRNPIYYSTLIYMMQVK